MRGRPLVLHPLLIAAYPVLFLFAENAAEQVTLDPLWMPLAAALAGGALLTVGLAFLLRDPLRAGLLASLALALFFGYGHAWNLLGGWLGTQWFLIGAWVVVALAGGVVVWRFGHRRGRWAAPATHSLNVLAAAAVAINVVSITGYVLASGGANGSSVPVARAGGELPTSRPDIYYIVPDRYANADVLRDIYGFDNSQFLDALEQRGFYVARESRANYPKTPLSLVSSLNMEYLDEAQLQAEANDGEDREPIHRRLRGSLLVPRQLQELGYSHIQVANWWPPTNDNADADTVYRYTGYSEFSTALLGTTLLRALEAGSEELGQWDWRVLREHTLYELDRLERIPSLPGPKFVFAHLLVPHDPYVFDVDGSFMDEAQVAAQGLRESYIRQLQYTNQRLLRVVDRIIAETPDAVILIQADEGPFPERYRADELDFDWTDATDAELAEKFGILNAYRLPGVNPEEAGLHRASTPVNAFRIVFNAYFGTDLPLLEERYYIHRDQRHFFEFFEVTDRLPD